MKRVLAWLALTPLLCAAAPTAPVVLRYQYRPGQVLEYRTAFEQHLRLRNPKGQLGNLDLQSAYLLDLTQKVNARTPAGDFEVEASPKNVQIRLDGPMARSAAQIAQMLEKVGFTLKLDAQGRVKVLEERPATPEALRKVVAALKSSLGQLLPMLPEGPQRPGSHWRQQTKLPIELPTGDRLDAQLTVDYLLRGYAVVQGRPCADIGMRLHVGIGGAMGQSQARVAVKGEGAGQGHAYLDLERGVLVATGVALATKSRFQGREVELHQSSEVQMRMVLDRITD